MISVNASTGARNSSRPGVVLMVRSRSSTYCDLFVADSGAKSHPKPNVVEINLRTHEQTLVTQKGSLLEPLQQPGPGNTIYLADSLADTTVPFSR